MHNLLEFIQKYNYWFLFVLLEVISMVLLFRFNSYQGSVWFTSANECTIRVDRFYGDILSYLNLAEVNRDLTGRNIVLQRQVSELRDRLAEYQSDTAETERLIDKAMVGYRMIPAVVVSSSLDKQNNYIVIDKGELDGIRSEMGVISGGGVVGIVYLTGPHYSLVLPVINSRSSISCRIRGHRFFGYLTWQGGSALYANVTDVPRYAKIPKGAYVETSGYSSVFPPGIFVGRVTAVGNSKDGLSYLLRVKLGTDFSCLRDVRVVATENRAEIDTLRVHALEAEQQTE